MNSMIRRKKGACRSQALQIPCGATTLAGELWIPSSATSLVMLVHPGGNGCFHPRNQTMARIIQKAGVGILSLDLLTPEEELDDITHILPFDIELLSQRLMNVTRWIATQPMIRDLKMGCLAMGTGGAAALTVAAEPDSTISALALQGGRPDLASSVLHRIHVPTLLIVGELDATVLYLNRKVQARLTCEKELALVSDATHLFEEKGAIETVADLAAHWFVRHLQIRQETEEAWTGFIASGTLDKELQAA